MQNDISTLPKRKVAINIIYNRRGMGYFVSSDALELITAQRREDFFSRMLPEVHRQMKLLSITADEVKDRLREMTAIVWFHHGNAV